MSATIKDVALLAGVSTTTVSHVLNKTRFVAPATHERVMRAADELHYAPSAVARSLKSKNTKSLGMLVTTTLNPFFAEVVKEVERQCYQQGYNLVLCNTDGELEKTTSYLLMLSQKRVDGILVMCSEYDDSLFGAAIGKRDLPMVVMDWGPSGDYVDRIQDNSLKGAHLAINHLIEQGHRQIAYIGGPLEKLPARQRYDGFFEAMAEAGLSVRPEWVIESNFEFEGGRLGMRALLACETLPSAVFIGNDAMAMGAMSEAQLAGIDIPAALSVIGYDNCLYSAYLSPPLTTIDQPKRRLAEQAVATMIERIDNPRQTGRVIMLEPDLVIRSSVRALSKK
ncbi:substrate-binding domain-containing protein [Larsenimonas suaedae]|uniref:Substrate-binding domain-containing protein n=1 Tax=Larsenimonas suaedae TaxID=1851019 RepID=A0ABU1GS37_9GAMM|nr:substrate-binding domain-containing protein [Larsenimonas suaedae]MCM2972379.1 substrate-binding domain-containing protein [Larsenimonas suaedae]MDR5894825.1 substrate-binding domain-containing protein [Larsenimonas suaedae]